MRTREGEQTGGRTGPRGQGREKGQRGSAATRIAPHCTRAGRRAEGQRRQGREEGVPRRQEGASVGQRHKGAPQPSEPPAVRGGTGQGGAPRRAAATHGHTTRARCVPATCVRSANTVSCKRWRGNRAGDIERRRPQEGEVRHACHKPRDQGAGGRQGEEGKSGSREGTARTGTRRQRAKDPGAWESGRGRTRENAPTRGRARPENGSGGGQQGGRVASRIASPRASRSRESDEGDRCLALGEHRGRGREQRGQGRG